MARDIDKKLATALCDDNFIREILNTKATQDNLKWRQVTRETPDRPSVIGS